MANDRIPVTILSGPLGAGKTTVVNHLLETADNRRIAVLVNDMGEINVDAELLEGSAPLASGAEGIAELSNGCICCELQDDLETEVLRLARRKDFDHLVVESSGISEPAPVAQLFITGSSAAARYRVDTTVTVVDVEQFLDFFDPESPIERTETEEGEPRPLSDLVIDQIEFCDVIVLNKCDRVSDDDRLRVEAMLRTLQSRAPIYPTVFGNVDPDTVLDTGRFDLDAVRDSAGWRRALAEHEGHSDSHDHSHSPTHSHDHDHDHDHERVHDHSADSAASHHRHPSETYGIESVAYRGRRPFHPERLYRFFNELPAGIVRAKGTFWVAGDNATKLLYSFAGKVGRVEPIGEWIASKPEIERELYRENHPELEWDDRWGDRQHGLVFIGTDIDDEALTAALDGCLLSDDELESARDQIPNPFPKLGDDPIEIERPAQQAQ